MDYTKPAGKVSSSMSDEEIKKAFNVYPKVTVTIINRYPVNDNLFNRARL